MAIRQSILAMYAKVSDGLQQLRRLDNRDEAERLRTLGREITGLTGSAGERGWHDELIQYFNAHPTTDSSEPVTPPTTAEIRDDLASETLILAPSWSYHAIAAGYLIRELVAALPRSEADTDVPSDADAEFLALAFAASPMQNQGFAENVRVGLPRGLDMADALSGSGITGVSDFFEVLNSFADLSSAVRTNRPSSVLRKVKQEYCSVVTTESTWETIDYDVLKQRIAPVNWPLYYQEFFCRMEPQAPDYYSWKRFVEGVSGDCARYELRTGLRFWTSVSPKGLFINYDMDPDRDTDRTDELVLVDNGYIRIVPRGNGVRVTTSKQLLISGMSATALTKLAETLGYSSNAKDMFVKAAAYNQATQNLVNSPSGKTPVDTSTTWPVMIPELPPSLRDEMCRDTTTFLKSRLDNANEIAKRFGDRWEDGIDLKEYDQFATEVGDEITSAAKEGFDLATGNFRPQPSKP